MRSFELFERFRAACMRLREATNSTHRNRLKMKIRQNALRRGYAILLQEFLDQWWNQFDAADAGPRVAFERCTEARAGRRGLV